MSADFVQDGINLADPALGAEVTFATDDFFAAKERLIQSTPPVFEPGIYDSHGKWMDGWESRRKRTVGHDFCIVKLGLAGVIRGVEIDTRHFTGNYPPAASIEACATLSAPDAATEWVEIVPTTAIMGNKQHFIAVHHSEVWTHVRLHIYPDGGVARLRVYGDIRCDWQMLPHDRLYDLASVEYGGKAVVWNDAHFGHPRQLTMPGRGANMGDGWETRRRREPGNDWCILKLGHPAMLRRIEVDTRHFRGNFPDRCSMQAAFVLNSTPLSLQAESLYWPILLKEQKLEPDAMHSFERELTQLGPVSHVRLNIHPDGGVSRLRVWGNVVNG